MGEATRTCNRCGKPYRVHLVPGECMCPPVPRSRFRRPLLKGQYAQYAQPRDWFYICKDAGTTEQRRPDLVRHYWDRHKGHRRWVPQWSPRLVVCGYSTRNLAERALDGMPAKLGKGAYIVQCGAKNGQDMAGQKEQPLAPQSSRRA